MRKPIGINVDQPLLRKQLRLIDTLTHAYSGLANVTCSQAVAKKRADLLDGLAEFISQINHQVKLGGDVVVYSNPKKPRVPRALATIALVIALGIPGAPSSSAAAAPDLDPGAHQTGPAECSRVLWVGGYRQQDTGNCPKSSGDPQKRRRKGYTDKDDQRRRHEDSERFRQERKAKHDADKAKEKQDREAKDKDAKAKKCRGIGAPANCSEPNPGHTGGSKDKAKGKKHGG